MIVRIWRARAALANPKGYPRHFENNVVSELRAVAGFQGATLLRKVDREGIDFLVITRWQSMDAIKGFAGEQVERAVVEPGAKAALVSFDEYVTHYEVLAEVDPR